MDFDAHDGNAERARRFGFAAWRALLNNEFAVILESSGSEGWHIYAVAFDFKPVDYWTRLFKDIAVAIGAPLQSGICEIFPPDSLPSSYGKGMRAPGAWNPETNRVSEICWQNADKLIAALPALETGKPRRIAKSGLIGVTSPIEKEILSLPPALSGLEAVIGSAGSFHIVQVATRHQKLQSLVGTTFHQVARPVAEHFARAQFAEKTVSTNADEATHLQDFTSLWEGLETLWRKTLSESEQERLKTLHTAAEQGAFRIIRSYAQNAAKGSAIDFPIGRDNLARRIGLTGEGAGLLRRKLVALGIIEQTASYRANVSAARYRWLPPLGIQGSV